uniref:Uncharacterized protein n=2 Tax=Enterobacteriaceae TaxID=543 RepID=A0A4D6IXK4_SALER|nr:hypothetical protein [Shigella dysenteriae 1]QCC70504.1 hypothetical protein [Salmonella enterica]
MALSNIALKRSVTRSERFFPFRCSQLRFDGVLTPLNAF